MRKHFVVLFFTMLSLLLSPCRPMTGTVSDVEATTATPEPTPIPTISMITPGSGDSESTDLDIQQVVDGNYIGYIVEASGIYPEVRIGQFEWEGIVKCKDRSFHIPGPRGLPIGELECPELFTDEGVIVVIAAAQDTEEYVLYSEAATLAILRGGTWETGDGHVQVWRAVIKLIAGDSIQEPMLQIKQGE
jgi:hypothetical protein